MLVRVRLAKALLVLVLLLGVVEVEVWLRGGVERSRTQEVRLEMVQGVLGRVEVVGRMMWAWVWEVMEREVEDVASVVAEEEVGGSSGVWGAEVACWSEDGGGAESGTGRLVVLRSLGGV